MAFDLLELNGTDLRREPIEVRKATLASILRKSRPGVRSRGTCSETVQEVLSQSKRAEVGRILAPSGYATEAVIHDG